VFSGSAPCLSNRPPAAPAPVRPGSKDPISSNSTALVALAQNVLADLSQNERQRIRPGTARKLYPRPPREGGRRCVWAGLKPRSVRH
jgi:hypothetical protein